MSTLSGPSKELWDHYKESIVDLYVERGIKLGNVIETMAQEHGFNATKSQYEAQFNKWKIRKNLARNDWHALFNILEKRKLEGKTSKVYFNDRLVPKSKIKKEQQRYGFKSSNQDTGNGLTYRLPEGIEIKSSADTSTVSQHNGDDEVDDNQWAARVTTNGHIQELGILEDNLGVVALPGCVSQYSDTRPILPLDMNELADRDQPQQMLRIAAEKEESCFHRATEAPFHNAVSPFTNGQMDRHRKAALARDKDFLEMISKGKENIILCGQALLLNYGISFNFTNVLRVSILNNWAGLGDKFIAQSLEFLPLNELLQFSRRPSLISEWLFESLIRLAVENGNVSMIKELSRLFSKVLNPNTFVCVRNEQWHTPLERASTLLHVELVEVLLDVKADANQTRNGSGPLSCVLRTMMNSRIRPRSFENEPHASENTNIRLKKARRIVELLIKAGSLVTDKILRDAEIFGDTKIMAHLLCVQIDVRLLVNRKHLVNVWTYCDWSPVLCRSLDESLVLSTFKRIEKSCALKLPHDSRIKLEILQKFLSCSIVYKLETLREVCMLSGAYYQSHDLMLALIYGRIEIAKSIIGSGVEVDTWYFYYSPGDEYRVHLENREILELSTKLQIRDSDFMDGINGRVCRWITPLSEAIRLKEAGTEICKLLEQRKSLAQITKNEEAFYANISAALESGNPAMVQKLVEMAMRGELFRLCKSSKNTSSLILDECLAKSISRHDKNMQKVLTSFGCEVNWTGFAGIQSFLAALGQRDIGLLHRLPSLALTGCYSYSIKDFKDSVSEKIVQEALRWGNKSVIEDLVTKGFHLDFAPIKHYFPWKEVLMHHGGNLDYVDFLLNLGAPLNPISASSAVSAAIKNNNSVMVNHLLKAGADPGESEYLDCAVKYSKDSVPQLLEAYKLQYPQGKRNYGVGALCSAIKAQDLVLSTEISQVADVNGSMHEAYYGLEKKLFGEDWSDSFSRDDYEQTLVATPLEVAIIAGQDRKLNLITILLQAGADPNRIYFRKVWRLPPGKKFCVPETAILTAIRAGANIDVIQLLLSYGADIYRKAAQGLNRTPLQYASEWGRTDIVEWLIRNKAEVNADPAEYDGGTALQLASESGRSEIVKILIQAQADVNGTISRVRGKTALQAAAARGWVGIAEILLSNYADVDAPGSAPFFMTALQLAAQNGRFLMVELLLKCNPCVEQVPLAIKVAKAQQHGSIVKRLEKFQETALSFNQPMVFDYEFP